MEFVPIVVVLIISHKSRDLVLGHLEFLGDCLFRCLQYRRVNPVIGSAIQGPMEYMM